MNRTLKYLPLLMAEGYLALTMLLFLFGPFDWPRVDSYLLSAFLVLYQVALAVGYYMGAHRSLGIRREMDVNYWFKVALLIVS